MGQGKTYRRFQLNKMFLFLTIVVLFLAFSKETLAQQQKCTNLFWDESPHAVINLMDSLPGLRPFMERFLDDSEVPRHLREIASKALHGDDVEIIHLTDELRKKYLISKEFDNFSVLTLFGYRTFKRPGSKPSLNARGGEIMRGETHDPRLPYPFAEDFSILIQDRPLSREKNDLIVFLHELAHVRLALFVAANIEKIARVMPDDFVRKVDDVHYEIEDEFWNYLNERFAYEIEFQVLEATHGKYFSDRPQDWDSAPLDPNDRSIRKYISDRIIAAYEMYDPRLVPLGDRKLYDILLNGIGSRRRTKSQMPAAPM